jgi:MerR family mercuric resistance operon transcriptional regulator
MARTIGTLAEQSGVDVETIRYYQRINLIEKPPKPTRGWRTYPDDALRRLKFIKRAQKLGFSLDEIRELLKLDARGDEQSVCERTERLVDEKLREVRSKIRDLEQIETALSRLNDACPGEGGARECPILEEFRFSMPEQMPDDESRTPKEEA